MGRKVAMLWHLLFSVGAGVLYFYFVLPRWHELMGDVPHSWGTALRIVTGTLIGLTALPVVFTLLRSRKPELGTPQLALSLRIWSIVAHVLAGVLIVGTAISEIWLSLDSVGPWLFAIYGAAAAIAVLGFFAFYLSFIAELPPPPPKPLKSKEPKQRRRKRKKGTDADTHDTEDAQDAQDAQDAEDTEAEDGDPVPADEADEAQEETHEDAEPDVQAEAESVEAPAESPETEPEPTDDEEAPVRTPGATNGTTGDEQARGGLRNRRPTGKTSHRRRRTRRGVAVEE
ncbi:hypothetical protein MB901379_04651 [Mycobacterium basiliense]|uniref:Transmembrane protein n=1 Tax=Mycobacterium basiliense TaxID=2094119 RepID=A0A447GKJ8_9MYCO|nr:hypothetical protein [Mycobacterium basiliense]VDM91037.1 hypothetical protein MB901379_04651 [Mycobacterium basiliense]